MARRKSFKQKRAINLYVEEEIYQEAINYIENFSAFFNRCIANQILIEKKKRRIIEKKEKEKSDDNIDVINCHYSSGRHNSSFDAKQNLDYEKHRLSECTLCEVTIDDATRDKLIDFYGVNVEEIRYICSNLSKETIDLFLNCCLSKEFIIDLKNEYTNVIKAVNYNIYQ